MKNFLKINFYKRKNLLFSRKFRHKVSRGDGGVNRLARKPLCLNFPSFFVSMEFSKISITNGNKKMGF